MFISCIECDSWALSVSIVYCVTVVQRVNTVFFSKPPFSLLPLYTMNKVFLTPKCRILKREHTDPEVYEGNVNKMQNRSACRRSAEDEALKTA